MSVVVRLRRTPMSPWTVVTVSRDAGRVARGATTMVRAATQTSSSGSDAINSADSTGWSTRKAAPPGGSKPTSATVSPTNQPGAAPRRRAAQQLVAANTARAMSLTVSVRLRAWNRVAVVPAAAVSAVGPARPWPGRTARPGWRSGPVGGRARRARRWPTARRRPAGRRWSRRRVARSGRTTARPPAPRRRAERAREGIEGSGSRTAAWRSSGCLPSWPAGCDGFTMRRTGGSSRRRRDGPGNLHPPVEESETGGSLGVNIRRRWLLPVGVAVIALMVAATWPARWVSVPVAGRCWPRSRSPVMWRPAWPS
jgi:hypothetical protein